MSLWLWRLQDKALHQEFTTPVLGDGVAQLEFLGKQKGEQIVAIRTLAGYLYLLDILDSRLIHMSFTYTVGPAGVGMN
ncbi:hypothetical protein H4R35_003326 [Dimargaris xerosporica]|nr:hypothetical protein H4R35_003326 [Dimargaris xerosporica]